MFSSHHEKTISSIRYIGSTSFHLLTEGEHALTDVAHIAKSIVEIVRCHSDIFDSRIKRPIVTRVSRHCEISDVQRIDRGVCVLTKIIEGETRPKKTTENCHYTDSH